MLNILPQEEKKRIQREYHLRVGVVSILAASGIALANLSFLAPAYLEAFYKEKNALERIELLEGAKNVSALSEADVSKRVLEINKDVASYIPKPDDGLPRSIPSDLFSKIIALKSDNIQISSLSYTFEQGKERVLISGSAEDRAGLASFVDVLKKDSYFTSVELPIQSYVESSDISFSLNLVRVVKVIPAKK